MQEQPTAGTNPGPDSNPAAAPEGTFLTAKRYPSEPAAAPQLEASPAPPAVRGRGVLTRVVLPLTIFVILVACIAWVAQYLPSKGPRRPAVEVVSTKTLIKFADKDEKAPGVLAVWPSKDPKMKYLAEFEQTTKGHYDFLFENSSDEEAEFGLVSTSCGCSNLEVCLLNAEERAAFQQHRKSAAGPNLPKEGLPNLKPQWTVLSSSDPKGIVVPPMGAGLARLNWDTRTKPLGQVSLQAIVWSQPKGHPKGRSSERLGVQLLLVPPVRCYPDKLDVGRVGPKTEVKSDFWCWSSTRDNFDLKVADSSDPCLRVEVEPCKELPDEVMAKVSPTQVRLGYHVTVTLFEEKDGRQLDMGFFQRVVPVVVRMDGADLQDVHVPVLFGTVRSDIQMVGVENGRIDLKTFASADGSKTHKVLLLAANNVHLQPKSQMPAFLQVSLKKKDSSTTQTTWELDVAVPAGALQGELGSDSAIILESIPQGRQPRRIRLPVTGTATR